VSEGRDWVEVGVLGLEIGLLACVDGLTNCMLSFRVGYRDLD
jgi:hypothetical protein